MGRELKRVPLDFDWPMNCTWKGYCNPYSPYQCKACEQIGLNPKTKEIYDNWQTGDCWHTKLTQDEVDALIESGRLKQDFPDVEKITAEMVNEKEKSKSITGYNNEGRWVCTEVRAKRLGVYGECHYCNGTGEIFCDEKYRKLQEEWEPMDPPTGEGYQL